MAVFDQSSARIVVEVVYDGPALAGKTTNLEQLCRFFTTHRRSDLYTTQNSGERTLFLDWLALEGGLVAGQKLRCQLITVPGQTVLARRRWHLLGRADVVVFVIDSTPRGLEEGRGMFEAVKDFCREKDRDLPIIVQANKQDRIGALPKEAVAQELGVDLDRVVEARADSGLGVRETAVVAIRGAADLVQRRVLSEGLSSLSGTALDGEQIKEEILAAEAADPRRPVEIFMEHARRVYPNATSAETDEPRCDEPDETRLTSTVPPAASEPASEPGSQVRPMDAPAAVPEDSASETPSTPPSRPPHADQSRPPEGAVAVSERVGSTAQPSSEPTLVPEARFPLRDTSPAATTQTDPPRATYATVRPGVRRLGAGAPSAENPLPPLPRPDPPSGFIWPSASGRDILRRVPLASAELRADLAGQVGTRDGSGRSDTLIFEAGVWCLKTSPRRRYEEVDKARSALLNLVRRKLTLGTMLVRNTVLTVQSDDAGFYWLWTISPWLTTLRAAMCQADDHEDDEKLEESLISFASAALESLRLAVQREVQLDVHPSNFATLDAQTYYVDDDIGNGIRVPSIGHSLLRRVEEYANCPEVVEAYVQHLATGIQSFSPEESRQLDLKSAFTDTIVRTVAGQVARRKLLEAVG